MKLSTAIKHLFVVFALVTSPLRASAVLGKSLLLNSPVGSTSQQTLPRTPFARPDSVRIPAQTAEAKPKYGPEATLLSQSHEYIRENAAPDYWAISPYYLSQQNDGSCSLASVAMVVNAARMGRKLTADDELATQSGILKRVADEDWTKAVNPGGHGVTLDQLKLLVEKSLKAYGVEKFSVEVVHADDTAAKTKAALHAALVANEKSASDFIIANFIQGAYTGDADVGHIAPVAAYDSKRKRVLVMDPDRQWYEPYWVSEDTFLKGMATQDKESGRARGYLVVRVQR